MDQGSRRLGSRRRRHRCAARAGRLHDLHARLEVGRAVEHRRVAAGTRRHGRRRGGRRRDRGLRHRPARPGRHRRRSAGEPGAHPAVEPRPALVERGAGARPDDARRDGPVAADPQARRVRRRPVLRRRRPHGAGDEAQRLAGVAVVRVVGAGLAARHRVDAASARRPRPLRDRHDGAPVGRGAPVRHVARAVEAGDVDAPPERHDRSAGDALHGRGGRLPPAHRECRRRRSRS